ncbi:MAG: hypothetical protein D3917_01585 [Candidatus Electrothrix sp. AX5]|nr:hypothetical protein [Candidatus Electrothrix sp. AX5]
MSGGAMGQGGSEKNRVHAKHAPGKVKEDNQEPLLTIVIKTKDKVKLHVTFFMRFVLEFNRVRLLLFRTR